MMFFVFEVLPNILVPLW